MTYYTSMAYICCSDDAKLRMLAIALKTLRTVLSWYQLFLTAVLFQILFYFILFMGHLFGEEVVCSIKYGENTLCATCLGVKVVVQKLTSVMNFLHRSFLFCFTEVPGHTSFFYFSIASLMIWCRFSKQWKLFPNCVP